MKCYLKKREGYLIKVLRSGVVSEGISLPSSSSLVLSILRS